MHPAYPKPGQKGFQVTHGNRQKHIVIRPEDQLIANEIMDLRGTQEKLEVLQDFIHMLVLRMSRGPDDEGLPANAKALVWVVRLANTWDTLAKLATSIGNDDWLATRKDRPFMDKLSPELLERYQKQSAIVAAIALSACKRTYEWLREQPSIWTHDGEPIDAVHVASTVFNTTATRLKCHSYWLTSFSNETELERNMKILEKLEKGELTIDVEIGESHMAESEDPTTAD